MSPIHKILKTTAILIFMMVVSFSNVKAQNWMFGVTGAGNLNYFTGTTQRLDQSYFVPTAFHKGTGIRPFGALLLEYNPGNVECWL